MKKFITVMFLLVIALAACSKTEGSQITPTPVENFTGLSIKQPDYAEEQCYKGIIYIRFIAGSDSRSAWGSVKYNHDGTVATCRIVNLTKA